MKEILVAEPAINESPSPLSRRTPIPATAPPGVEATVTPLPSPQPTPTPEVFLSDGTYIWRWGAWRDPVTDKAWVPAAPAPSAPAYDGGGYAYGTGSCPAIIANALGRAGCLISYCESGWDANAIGDQGRALGYFQVRSDFHYDATLDPAGNVAAAVRISGGGVDWSAWSVRGVLTTGRCPNGTVPPV